MKQNVEKMVSEVQVNKGLLSKEQIVDILKNVLCSPVVKNWKGDNIQFCCTVHGESHPSCGINCDFVPEDEPNTHLQLFHCFSCGESGSIAWLIYRSQPEKYRSLAGAEAFILKKYGVDVHREKEYDISNLDIKRYEDFYGDNLIQERFTVPREKLALFKSGKETYQYFFDRGFDKEDVKEFMIGRDLENETVTIPAFWENGELAGVIGRYIDKNRPKNMRYKIYSFPKSSILYPLDKLKVSDNTIIGVESMLDVIMLHKWGIKNAVALMGNAMSNSQAEQIKERCTKFIALFDKDSGGKTAITIAKRKLKGLLFLEPTYYPYEGKDPSEWGELETLKVIKSAKFVNKKSIPKL